MSKEPARGEASPPLPLQSTMGYTEGSGAQATSMDKVVKAQVYFILSTIREDQYDAKVRQLEQV